MLCRILLGLVALVLLALVRVAIAQEPSLPTDDGALRTLIEGAGDAKANDGADLVTVLWNTSIDVEDSGLAHTTNREVIKCLSEKGAADLARLRLDFDPASNMIDVRRLRIFRQDGTVEELSGEGVDLPQPQQMIWWGAQMKLIPVPRLNVGDAIEIETYMKGFLIAYLQEGEGESARGGDERYIPPMEGHFYDVVYFHKGHPVKLRRYSLTTPRDKPVRFEVYNGEVFSYVSYDNEHLKYVFWESDQPAYHHAPNSADASDVVPKVVLATVPDWPTKSRWFYEVNETQFEANDAIRATVAEITRGLKTDDDKIAAIVHWSADEIRYAGISMGQGEGYTLHPGSMIFDDRSGVCKDKAGMAITMLRAAGYEVYAAMTMAGSRVERIPADQFNHAVVALKKPDGSFVMLDPTWVVFSPEVWSSAEGEQNYVIGSPEGEELMRTPSFAAPDHKLRLEARSSVDAQGALTGRLTFSAEGYADQRLRREMVHYSIAPDRQAWFENVVHNLGAGALLEPVKVSYARLRDVTRPVEYQIDYHLPDFALVGADAIYFSPPTSRHLVDNTRLAPYLLAAEAETVEAPLLFWAPRMRDVTETISLPAGFGVARLPEDRQIDNAVGALLTHIEPRGNKLIYTYELQIKKRAISKDEYPLFRELVQEALALPKDLIVLERR